MYDASGVRPAASHHGGAGHGRCWWLLSAAEPGAGPGPPAELGPNQPLRHPLCRRLPGGYAVLRQPEHQPESGAAQRGVHSVFGGAVQRRHQPQPAGCPAYLYGHRGCGRVGLWHFAVPVRLGLPVRRLGG